MYHKNSIYSRRKALFIKEECKEYYGRYYCGCKICTIPIDECIVVEHNSSKRNKYLIKSNPDIPIKLQKHTNIKFWKYTYLYWSSSSIIIDDIPKNIICIQYKGILNIVNYLPLNLQNLSLGGYFNHPVDNLPPMLKVLKFGYKFNHPVNNLPCGLEEIWFGHQFNQQLDYLPESIIYIELCANYSNNMTNLPIGIQKIKLDISYQLKENTFETIKLLENKIIWKKTLE